MSCWVLIKCLAKVLGNLSTWQHPVIILKDIKYKELSGIVEFIYHGEVSIDQECLPGFLHAAESLRIKGLTEDKKVGSNHLHGVHVEFNKNFHSSFVCRTKKIRKKLKIMKAKL